MAAAPQDRPRRSDVDFADVFGGPPRRSSGHDHLRRGRSRAESLDASYALSRGWSTGSAPGERAVFGERASSDRRRQLGEEFYSDIFPGSECPSPRRSGGDRNVFGRPASPGSTIRPRLSCSFSMKWGRGMDNSMPTSPSHHAASRNDDGTSYAYSLPSSPNSSINSFFAGAAPSRFRSQNGDKKDASHYVNSMESEHQGTPASLESYINKNKFHFSFYKWAGKGALLVMPAPSQEKGEKVIGLRGFPQVVVQGIDLIDNEDNMSTTTGASKSQTDYEDCKSGKDSFMERKDSTNSTSKEGAVPLLFDNYMQSDKAEEPGTKSSADDAKINVLAASPSSRNSKSPSGDRSRGSRVKGKVKDFIKIFTPEGSPKRKGTFESQDQRSSGKNGRKDGVQDKISISSSEANEDVKTTQMNKEAAFWAATSPMKEVQEKMEEPVLKVDSEMQASTGISSESIHDASKDKEGNREGGEGSHIEDLEGCVVEHLSEDQYDSLQNDHEKEQIKISESKIREWSKGKEGNIRSLLSTLQYVLWPESGWQPVPLVNIIEGAAVKKAYQKALLCLHPDKLQQRGAAMHQKYIAEKVFDILQEAWTEFNSVSFG